MTFSFLFNIRFLLLSAVLLAEITTAAEPVSEQNSRWQFALAVGYGLRTNPVMDNDDIPLIVLPSVAYQGEHFFIQNLDLGYQFVETHNQRVSLLLTPSYDQLFFNRWDANNFFTESTLSGANMTGTSNYGPKLDEKIYSVDKNKLHERRMAALGGLEYSVSGNNLDLQVQALHEVTGYYQGNELRVALSKNIELKRNQIKLTVGTNWQSSKTLNYFYGVRPHEAESLGVYEPDAGIVGMMRIDWTYQLDEHWSLLFFTSYRHLGNSITHSPLITHNSTVTAFAGGVYHF